MCGTLVRIWRSTGDEAALVDVHARPPRRRRAAVRRAPDGDQHLAVELRLRRPLALEADAQALRRRLDAGHLRAEQDAFVAPRDALLERPHQVAVAARHQPRRQLDDADRDAERVVHAGHLEADDAAADHQQALGQVELERAGGVDDARIVRQARQPHRLRARGDDALLEARRCALRRPASTCELVRARRTSRRRGSPSTLRCFASASRPPVRRATTRVLPVAQLRGIDLGRAERDAVLGHRRAPPRSRVPRAAAPWTGMQPTLRQTPPSVGPALDQRHPARGRRRGTRRCSRRGRRRARPGRNRSACRRGRLGGVATAARCRPAGAARRPVQPRRAGAIGCDRHGVEVRLAAVGLGRAQRRVRRRLVPLRPQRCSRERRDHGALDTLSPAFTSTRIDRCPPRSPARPSSPCRSRA